MERLFENLGLVKHPELPGALFLDPTIAKASRGIVPGPHKGGLQHLIEPAVAMANVLTHIGL